MNKLQMTATETIVSRPSPRKAMAGRILAIGAMVILLATGAHAEEWYLMAPSEKIVSEPRVAIRMEHGPVVGPLEFISRAKFASRAECEPERQRLITAWRQQSVIKRGSWDRYGFTSPSAFIRCVPAGDQQLKKTESASGMPSMETFVNRPAHR